MEGEIEAGMQVILLSLYTSMSGTGLGNFRKSGIFTDQLHVVKAISRPQHSFSPFFQLTAHSTKS
jgi:hypothetical protein